MDLTLLTTLPEGAPSDGLDAVDPRFVALATLVEKGDYAAAAGAAGRLLAERVLDVRVIGYFAYGVLHQGGPAALGPVAAALAELYRSRLDLLGPQANKARHLQASMAWLVKQIARRLERDEAAGGEAWARWTEAPAEELDRALAGLDALRGAVVAALADRAGGVADGLAKLAQRVERLRAVARRAPEPAGEIAPEPEEPAVSPGEGGPGDAPDADGRSPSAASPPDAPGPSAARGDLAPPDPASAAAFAADGRAGAVGGPEAAPGASGPGDDLAPRGERAGPIDPARASPALRELLRKLAAFEELLAQGKLPQARIVADDVQATLDRFDPRLFFPGLFAGFLRLVATRADDLAAAEAERESPRWKALAEYYRVDVDGFTRL